MTVYEGVPSFRTFFYMKLANRAAVVRHKEKTHALRSGRAWVQSLVRLVAHLAGFALLTGAGFSLNMTAGLITAGISCFVFAWLMSDSSTETDKRETASIDPMASRR